MLLSHVSFLTSLKSYSIIYQIPSFKNLIMNLYNPILVSIYCNPVFASSILLKALPASTGAPAAAAAADILAPGSGAPGVIDTAFLNHSVLLAAAPYKTRTASNGIFCGSNNGLVLMGGRAIPAGVCC